MGGARVIVILLRAFLLSRAVLAAEILALCHQRGVLRHSAIRLAWVDYAVDVANCRRTPQRFSAYTEHRRAKLFSQNELRSLWRLGTIGASNTRIPLAIAAQILAAGPRMDA